MVVNCGRCRRPYVPAAAEWGDLCGQCLARQIEDFLAMGAFGAMERKVPLRAGSGGGPGAFPDLPADVVMPPTELAPLAGR